MCADKTKCVDINFRCELFVAHPDCEDGSDEMNCNITGRFATVALVCVCVGGGGGGGYSCHCSE